MAPRLRDYFREVFRLLLMMDPVCGAYDVEWHGPYFVPRRRVWWPSYFRLYGGRVYRAIVAGSRELQVSWAARSGEFEMERGLMGGYEYADPEEVWAQAAPQLAGKMLSALRNPEAYNRRVARDGGVKFFGELKAKSPLAVLIVRHGLGEFLHRIGMEVEFHRLSLLRIFSNTNSPGMSSTSP